MRVQLIAPAGLPLFEQGADLAALVVDALAREGEALAHHDIVVVTAKAVSKAQGRVVVLGSITPSARTLRLAELTDKDPRLVELVLTESTEVIRAAGQPARAASQRLGLGDGRGRPLEPGQ